MSGTLFCNVRASLARLHIGVYARTNLSTIPLRRFSSGPVVSMAAIEEAGLPTVLDLWDDVTPPTPLEATSAELDKSRKREDSSNSTAKFQLAPAVAYGPPYSPTRRAAEGDIVSIAPMMDWTDRHYRYMMRLLTRRTRLYTEMVVDNTLLYAKHADEYLRFDPVERPIACQLGGSDPNTLAAAAMMVEAAGYDEINLNCGCPSPRVAGKGCFGAALMFSPELVRDCVAAMMASVKIPITVKCRLGADSMDTFEEFRHFVEIVSQSGCKHFIIHARKAILKGLDPKGNRTVPKLKYDWVQRLSLEFPHLRISINGGITSWEQTEQLLRLTRVSSPDSAPTIDQLPPLAAEISAGGGADGHDSGTKAGDDECGAAAALTDAASPPRPRAGSSASAGDAADEPSVQPTDAGSYAARYGRDFTRFQRLKADKAKHDAIVGRIPNSQFHAAVGHALAPAPAMYGTQHTIIDSVMIGRAAYNNAWIFADVDRRFFGVENPGYSRREVISKYIEYCDSVMAAAPAGGEKMPIRFYRPFELAKPLIGLFAGEYGSGHFRKTMSQLIQEQHWEFKPAVLEALKCIPDAVLDERPPAGL